jgi:hypothetical protein
MFFEKFVVEPFMERRWEMFRVHGWEPAINPVTGFRNLGWTLIGITAASMVVVLYGGLMLEGGVIVVAESAAGAGMESGAEVISLAAYRAMRASQAAKGLARAAGVLIVLGMANKTEASPTISGVDAVRAVSSTSLEPAGARAIGTKVKYGGRDYIILGKAVVP